MALYTEAVQKLYVAYFSRPADAAGLAYWENVVTAAKGNTAAVSAAFAASQEYKDTFAGQSAYQVINTIYQNLFGRQAEAAALTFWGQGLLNGNFTIDNAVTAIASGAQGTDLVAYNSKVAAATAFTAALDTPAEMIGYNGTAANNAAKAWMAGITTEATLKAAIEPAALNGTVGSVTNPPVIGQTYNLTQGLDTLNGTSANDTFNAYSFNTTTGGDAITLNMADAIDGGAGNDTLNIDVTAARNSTLEGSFKNIETININAAAATAAVAVDASKFAGATTINQIGKAGAVTKLAAGTTAGFVSTGADALSVTAAAAAASAAVNLSGVADTATLAIGGATLAAVTVSGTRTDVAEDGMAQLELTVTAGEDVQSIKVTSNQSTKLTIVDTDSADKVTAVDASASTARITFTGDADVVTITSGSGNDQITFAGATSAATASAAAVNASISTGAGTDVINVGGTGTGIVTVDAGAGNDSINVTKVAGLGLNVQGGEGNDTVSLAGAALATADVINGGAGTDTVAVAGSTTARTADDFIVFNKLLTGFETIKFTSAEVALDVSKLAANYTTVDLFGGSSVTKVGTQALVANGALTATAAGYGDSTSNPRVGTLNITEKVSGTVVANAEIANLTVASGTTATAAVLTGDLKTANVVLTNAVNATSNATADTVATVTIDSANLLQTTSLTLSGNGSAFVTNSAAGKLTTIDASALGGTYTLGANAGKAIAGLTLVSAETSAETVKLGAGIDTVTLNASTYGAMDTVSGLNLVVATGGTALAASSDKLFVGGAATGAAKFTTTQTDLDLALKDAAASSKGDVLVFQMAGDTYVYVDAGTAGSVDAADTVVKLTGTIDLDALILALGTPVV